MTLCLCMVLSLMPAAALAAEQTYTVRFAGPSTGSLKPITAAENTEITLPCTTTQLGSNGTKVFKYFTTEEDGSGETYTDCDTYTVTSDVTLYTQWADIAVGNSFLNEGEYLDCAGNVSVTELTAKNATGSIVMQPGERYCADLAGIFAKDADAPVYVAAVYSDGTAAHCTGVLPYSIGAYLTSHAAKETNFRTMAQVAAVYCSYCKEYFKG